MRREREREREKENSRTFGDRRISGKEDIDPRKTRDPPAKGSKRLGRDWRSDERGAARE